MRPTASRVTLERPAASHERNYVDACHRSRALHRGLVVTPATPSAYRAYLERSSRPTQESFFVVTVETGELAGVVDILDITRDAESEGRLAYFALVPYAGLGLMREGVAFVIEAAFRELGLVRLQADIQSDNARSRALAERLGFRRSDSSSVQLKIGARWLAHERWTLLRAEWLAARDQELPARA